MKKTYYIIGVSHATCGLMAIWKNTVAHIIYAKEKGYIPIVDLQHFQNQYFKDGRVFKDNTWEYFFKQPELSLDDLKPTDSVILSENKLVPDEKYALYDFILPETKAEIPQVIPKLYREYQKYLNFTPNFLSYLSAEQKKLLPNPEQTLGILCRGTDYLALKPTHHPIQPEPRQVIEKAKEMIEKYHFKKIFLATEDETIYQLFCQEFKGMIIDTNQLRFNHLADQFLSERRCDQPNQSYHIAKKYLLSLYILSQCGVVLAGQTAGSIFIYLLSDFFKQQREIFIWKLGHYGETIPLFRFHLGKFDLFSKYKKNNTPFYRILGIKIKL